MTSLRLSKYHQQHPFSMNVNGENFGVEYWPGDSRSGMFGGNSNWRGPIWLATNFLLIESLQRFHQYYGNALQVECPSGSGAYMNLANVAKEIQRRIIGIFQSVDGRRPTNGGNEKMNCDPNFKDLILFHEVCAKPCRTLCSTIICFSSSTATMVVASVHLIRPVGQGLLPIKSFSRPMIAPRRIVSAVSYPGSIAPLYCVPQHLRALHHTISMIYILTRRPRRNTKN